MSSQEASDRISKAYVKYIVYKNNINNGVEKSDVFKIVNSISRFNRFQLSVIPLRDNLRAQFLSRKFIVEGWKIKPFIWKGEFPTNS